jgi:hypothetical protein
VDGTKDPVGSGRADLVTGEAPDAGLAGKAKDFGEEDL